jgi:hypothetical protein
MTRHGTFMTTFDCLAALALGGGHPAQAQSSCAPGQNSLIIYHAGGLSAAFTAVKSCSRSRPAPASPTWQPAASTRPAG